MDGNGYPDLAVGSLSDTVLVYRLDASHSDKSIDSVLIRSFAFI